MAIIKTVLGKTPTIHESVFLAETAAITGEVNMAEKSSAFYGVSARGDSAPISVGARSNLQDNVVLHADEGFPCSIGEDVSVGHAAIVHGATVGDGALIGMNATVLNGAVVGAGSLVAANSMVPEGMEIPPNSLVAGVPAKVRRELTPEQVAGLRTNAEVYVRLSAAHLEAEHLN
ncbi:gamma carbonic anhydrase family protein [Enteractinococcus coprophilus]|uniref:Carbonic anhydrase/acetyltransferase-like protein (Isoleucine patch superfamily) n=1 Tax=Enteractinococcus coprophilus TaxID=1027633 RepID=A0A543AFK3_9MICC|nr:gamma carbonic anhydrase family protein [Enteractinococcus coprophilus]TQL71359.1 carbonic anhydrase/acetyltransferase-like protein (isoleucine patch superfamily) [Enteractinococcus coprophilus]